MCDDQDALIQSHFLHIFFEDDQAEEEAEGINRNGGVFVIITS